jgi:hypothetical protein
MKIFSLVLAGSLVANAVLTVVVARRWTAIEGSGSPEARAVRASSSGVGARGGDATGAIKPATWSALDVLEPTGLAAELRARDFPPAIVRAIIHAQVRERLASRYKAIADAAAALPYWRGPAYSLSADPKLERARRALDREASELVAQLLGPSTAELSEPARRMFQRQYGDLSPEKISEMQRIQADYSDLLAEVRSEARGLMLPEDAAKLAFLEKEMRSDLARLLAPEELEAVELRSSGTAARLRSDLSAFNPSEEEFRALFQIQRSVDTHFGEANAGLTPDQRRLRDAAQQQLAAQVEAALGPERYAEYKRTTDPAWRTLDRFITQLGLPASATSQLMAVQQDLTQRVTAVRIDSTLTPQQQQLQLAALAQEAKTRLSPLLGERGLAAYQQNIGYWMKSLQPAPQKTVRQ